jgi:hypothetical protein
MQIAMNSNYLGVAVVFGDVIIAAQGLAERSGMTTCCGMSHCACCYFLYGHIVLSNLVTQGPKIYLVLGSLKRSVMV